MFTTGRRSDPIVLVCCSYRISHDPEILTVPQIPNSNGAQEKDLCDDAVDRIQQAFREIRPNQAPLWMAGIGDPQIGSTWVILWGKPSTLGSTCIYNIHA